MGKENKALDPENLFKIIHATGDKHTFRLLEVFVEEWPNDAVGLDYLALCYFLGRGTSRDYKRAFDLFKRSADLGNAAGYMHLGEFYEAGWGTEKNVELAADNYLKAAHSNNWDEYLRFRLSVIVQNNPGNVHLLNAYAEFYRTAKNFELAHEYYLRSSRLDDAIAKYNLGLMAENGEGTDKDIIAAADWYLEAAQAGYDEAVKRLEGLAAQLKPDPAVLINLALCYEKKYAVGQEVKKAQALFEKAAEAKSVGAMCKLGDLFINSTVEADHINKAAEWYYKAAQAGNYLAAVTLSRLESENPGNANLKQKLGCCYYSGLGLGKEQNKGLVLLREAAELGNGRAMANLAQHYFRKWDRDNYVAWIYEAIKHNAANVSNLHVWMRGDGLPAYELGACYFDGLGGTPIDWVSAIDYFKKAPDDERALCHLGIAYEEGRGVEKNLATALKYYLAAARKNKRLKEGAELAVRRLLALEKNHFRDPLLFQTLALCYENGWGIAADPVQAAHYYQLQSNLLMAEIDEGGYESIELPHKLLSLHVAQQRMFSIDLKLLKVRCESLHSQSVLPEEEQNELKSLEYLIRKLQSILHDPGAMRSVADDVQMHDYLLKLNTDQACRLYGYATQAGRICHHLQQIYFCLHDLKRKITEKQQNNEWYKKRGLLWVKGMPQGIETTDVLLLKLEGFTPLELLMVFDRVVRLFAEKQDEKPSRDSAAACFYKEWHNVFVKFFLDVDYAKVSLKSQQFSTANISKALAPSRVEGAKTAVSDWLYNSFVAKPAKPMFKATPFDLVGIPPVTAPVIEPERPVYNPSLYLVPVPVTEILYPTVPATELPADPVAPAQAQKTPVKAT